MARNRDVPDLLERFMKESGETQRWVTVSEIRAHFNLDEFAAPSISGFLRRIYHGPFFSCQYRVERIEKVIIQKPQRRIIRKYLVTKRFQPSEKKTEGASTQCTNTYPQDVFTDSVAIEHFDRVLQKNRSGSGDSHR